MKTKEQKTSGEKSNSPPLFSAQRGTGFLGVQPKLSIGKPGDKYEQEADQVADKVVQHSNEQQGFFGDSGFFSKNSSSHNIQEKPLAESISPLTQRQEEEEELQPKFIQRQEEEEEELQMKQIQKQEEKEEEMLQAQTEKEEEIQASSENSTSIGTTIENNLKNTPGGSSKMDAETRSEMEAGFRTGFGNVNIHTGPAAVQMSRQLGAQAFTHGNNIFFNNGKYNPQSQEGKHLLAHELTHTLQQISPSSSIQKQEGYESNLDRLNEMLDKWNVPEEEVISICTELDAREKAIVRTNNTYKTRMANALNVGEMISAVNNLGFSLETKLNWVKASATFGTTFIEYSEIKAMVTAAPQSERDVLKTSTTAGKSFFVGVCTNETMVEALNDLQFDLITKLTWLKAEMTITSWELSYSTIQPWIIHANTTQTERDSLKTNTIVGRDFFVDVCTNATMVTALDDLQFDLVTKLTWLKAEMTITSWELSYPAIQPWIIHANTTQTERDALKTEAWKEFFINVCTNVTIIAAVTDLQFDLKTKIEWVRTEAGLEEVKQVIELATQADRDVVWNDATYLNTLRSEVGDDYYLWVIVKLRMLFVGTVSHTSALDADAAIQAHLAAYVSGGVAAGRKIEGFVAVVDTTNWNIAGEHHYGASVWATKSINGFVDNAGRVWIEQNSGNPGTMVHEATHKYSSDQLIGVSQPLNEGVTEYFTRLVCNADGINIAGRANYQNNWTTVTKLVTLVGEVAVADAYFDGDMETLENTFVAAKSASDWTNFITETKNKNWSAADGYL